MYLMYSTLKLALNMVELSINYDDLPNKFSLSQISTMNKIEYIPKTKVIIPTRVLISNRKNNKTACKIITIECYSYKESKWFPVDEYEPH